MFPSADPIVAGICDECLVAGADIDSSRRTELRVPRPSDAELAQERAIGLEDLDAGVQIVSDEDVARVGDRHVNGGAELTGTGAFAPGTGDCFQFLVELGDLVGTLKRDPAVAECIDVDSKRNPA